MSMEKKSNNKTHDPTSSHAKPPFRSRESDGSDSTLSRLSQLSLNTTRFGDAAPRWWRDAGRGCDRIGAGRWPVRPTACSGTGTRPGEPSPPSSRTTGAGTTWSCWRSPGGASRSGTRSPPPSAHHSTSSSFASSASPAMRSWPWVPLPVGAWSCSTTTSSGIWASRRRTCGARQNAKRRELRRREQAYRGNRPVPDIAGKVVILVDDGLATGSSMRAAIQALQALGPARIVVAVPAAPESTCQELAAEVDEVVCATTPSPFFAVGASYYDFTQTTDDEVRELLQAASLARPAKPAWQGPSEVVAIRSELAALNGSERD